MKLTIQIFLLTLVFASAHADYIEVVDRPPSGERNSYYASNRAPLISSPFAKLPIGSIKPKGWLRKQLELQAEGICGNIQELSSFCLEDGNAWLTENGDGHGFWEEVPYWLKGYGDLAYVLDDAEMQLDVQKWIEAVLASQREDGWFGPSINLASPRRKSSMEGEEVRGRPDMWPNALMLSVLRSNFEHTGDERIINHMLNYCDWLIALPEKDFLIHWVGKRRGVELLKNILWLYNVSGEEKLLNLAHKTHRRTNDWVSGISRYHNVDFAECFYEPGLYYTLSGKLEHYNAVERNHSLIYDEFGQVPGGMFGGDEEMRPGYTGPRQAVETCGMVEMMHSSEIMLSQVDGLIKWADRLEDVAFNSYPAALTAEMDGLRYLTAPNMPVSDFISKKPDIYNYGPMYLMDPYAHRCCQHNHAHGWPYYAEYLWLATADNGLCPIFYSASSVTAKVGDGQTVVLEQKTHYPFEELIEFSLQTGKGTVDFPLYLRIPGWCSNPEISVNGSSLPVENATGNYVRIKRAWKNGDKVTLHLPMNVSVRTWERNKDSVSVDRGPLTYSVKIKERKNKITEGRSTAWPAYEIFPESPWNYGLLPEMNFEVVKRDWPENDMPWTHEGAPIAILTKAHRIPEWTLQVNNLPGAIQQSPIRSNEPEESIELLPMGACRLRISAFPVIGSGADVKVWHQETPKNEAYTVDKGWQVIVSQCKEGLDGVSALFDGVMPKTPGKQPVPKLTFQPNKGTLETISIEFGEERLVKGVEVYWYDDSQRDGCRVPEKALLYYFTLNQWMPTGPSEFIPVEPMTFNRIDIEPVKTTALELRIQLQRSNSGGVMEINIL